LDLQIGDVVRVPVGTREHVGFAVTAAEPHEVERPLRRVTARLDVPRAFDPTGLALAKFVSEYYVCTLGEALGAAVLSGAIPRTIDTFAVVAGAPDRKRYPSVPVRLLALIWEELRENFTLERLLRHPEARRAGDRTQLLRHVNTLVRSGDLRRVRSTVDPRTHEYRVRVLTPGSGTIRGPKANALAQFVRAQPGVPRADALLAGFSNAVIARAISAGVIEERTVARTRNTSQPALSLTPALEPTPEQRGAIDAIAARVRAGHFSEMLLHGITGSGKTLVYIEAIAGVLRYGGRAIVLVPEISLTPQTARRFEEAFGGRVAVLHSALSERERFEAWRACADGIVDVLVGARSAVFAPLSNVRLLVVDESHEGSYKQDSTPRYHAVTVARERMRIEGGVLVLGSATPSLESYRDAIAGRIELLRLRTRATAQELPAVRVVDMGREFEGGNRRIFSAPLMQALDERLRAGEKTVLFVNRRGSAGFILCRACGFVPQCRRCSVALTAHRSEGVLRCHYCDASEPIPARCPKCGAEAIREFGAGTQRVEQDVRRLFPGARVVRMDSDTTTRVGDHARLLDEFGSSADVLVGTQMVAKGLDFPQVTLVGVVAADIGLHAPDFRAAERSFDLIAQVCGRSGRARPGQAIVQTYAPAHRAIVFAAAHDYDGFAASELEERDALGYPPARALVYAGVIARRREAALGQARRYAELLANAAIEVLGPAPYPIARMNDEWRFRLALRGNELEPLRAAIRDVLLPAARADRASRIVLNVDP